MAQFVRWFGWFLPSPLFFCNKFLNRNENRTWEIKKVGDNAFFVALFSFFKKCKSIKRYPVWYQIETKGGTPASGMYFIRRPWILATPPSAAQRILWRHGSATNRQGYGATLWNSFVVLSPADSSSPIRWLVFLFSICTWKQMIYHSAGQCNPLSLSQQANDDNDLCLDVLRASRHSVVDRLNPFACSAASHPIAAFKWERERNIFEIVTKLLGIFQRAFLSKSFMCFCVDTFLFLLLFGGLVDLIFMVIFVSGLSGRFVLCVFGFWPFFVVICGSRSFPFWATCRPQTFSNYTKRKKKESHSWKSRNVCVRLSAR